MRLGGMFHRPETIRELDSVVERLDTFGLSAVVAPKRLAEMSDDEAIAFGERARELDIVIGEAHFLVNLLTRAASSRVSKLTRKCASPITMSSSLARSPNAIASSSLISASRLGATTADSPKVSSRSTTESSSRIVSGLWNIPPSLMFLPPYCAERQAI